MSFHIQLLLLLVPAGPLDHAFRPPFSSGSPSDHKSFCTRTGFIPTLEFAEADQAYVQLNANASFGTGEPGYYDNRCVVSGGWQLTTSCQPALMPLVTGRSAALPAIGNSSIQLCDRMSSRRAATERCP